ncbi:MAG: hypothetical protein J6M18_01980 [Actinomycetaceae bacterium]|nr:hypothetical protein [Actinomycetaceae bacterium]
MARTWKGAQATLVAASLAVASVCAFNAYVYADTQSDEEVQLESTSQHVEMVDVSDALAAFAASQVHIETQITKQSVVSPQKTDNSTVVSAQVQSQKPQHDIKKTSVKNKSAQKPTASRTQDTNEPAHYTVQVNCAGTQTQIDTCAGATNYKPVSDFLGVPYYAQHNGMGGEAWLKMKVGDYVTVGGKTYRIAEIKTVTTGGSANQIKNMGGKAYLQTCLANGYQSKVFALQ